VYKADTNNVNCIFDGRTDLYNRMLFTATKYGYGMTYTYVFTSGDDVLDYIAHKGKVIPLDEGILVVTDDNYVIPMNTYDEFDLLYSFEEPYKSLTFLGVDDITPEIASEVYKELATRE